MSDDTPKEYDLTIHTNDVYAAVAQAAGALYELIEEALQTHEGHEAEECDFELFARDMLAVLERHADQLGSESWREASETTDLD